MEDRQGHAEAAGEALDELWGDGDLGNQHQDPETAGESLRRRRHVHLRLPAGGHTVEEDRSLPPDELEGCFLLRAEGRTGQRGPRGDGVGQELAVPGLPLGGPGPAGPAAPHARWQHGPQALDQGRPVVAGHHPGQLDLMWQQERGGVCPLHLPDLDLRAPHHAPNESRRRREAQEERG